MEATEILRDPTVEQRLVRHLRATQEEYARYSSLCRSLDNSYKPERRMAGTMAWDVNPEDVKVGQARVSVPMIWNAVNLKSNILGMRTPTPKVRPLDRRSQIKRIQAEGVETAIDRLWDDENMDEVYLNFCRTMGLYGRGILQDGVEAGESYTTNIDQQYNLWISWRRLGEPEAMCFSEMVSEQEALDLGWDGVNVNAELRFNFPIYGGYTHSDPLGIQNRNWTKERSIHGKIPVLHFYFQKTKNGTVHYARFVNGQKTVKEKSLGRKTWPFTIVEAEHVPGIPYGVGDAEPLLDIQAEYNIRRTEWAEAIRRNIKDQWKMWGLKGVNPRMVPGNGGRVWELTDKNEEDIEPLKFPVDDVGAVQNIQSIMSDYRRTSAIPAEAEADNTAAAPTSGFAMQVKFQALITQLAPRQKRIKRALKGWALSKLDYLAKKYPEYKDLLDAREFTIDWEFEPLTPKDVAQVVQNLATAVGAKLESPHTAMEEMGLDPDLEMDLMAEFWTDPRINPQGAMAQAQAMMMLAQVAQMSAQQPGAGFTGNQLDQRAREEAAAMAPSGDETRNQHNPLPMRQGASQVLGAHPMGGV